MDNLSDEVLLEILVHLNKKELANMRLVSKFFNRLCQDEILLNNCSKIAKIEVGYELKEFYLIANGTKYQDHSFTIEYRNEFPNILFVIIQEDNEFKYHLNGVQLRSGFILYSNELFSSYPLKFLSESLPYLLKLCYCGGKLYINGLF